MKAYGIPLKIINMIKALYKDTKVAVIHNGTKTDWFDIQSGVKQGCVMSGFLFLLVVDWVMHQTTKDKPRGLQWTNDTYLEDLDYADDIVSLSQDFNLTNIILLPSPCNYYILTSLINTCVLSFLYRMHH